MCGTILGDGEHIARVGLRHIKSGHGSGGHKTGVVVQLADVGGDGRLVQKVVVGAAGGHGGQGGLVEDVGYAGGVGLVPVHLLLHNRAAGSGTSAIRDDVLVGAVDIGDGEHHAGSARVHRDGGREARVAGSTRSTGVTGGAGSSIHTIGYGIGGSGVVAVVNGVGVHIVCGAGLCNGVNTHTVLAVIAGSSHQGGEEVGL